MNKGYSTQHAHSLVMRDEKTGSLRMHPVYTSDKREPRGCLSAPAPSVASTLHTPCAHMPVLRPLGLRMLRDTRGTRPGMVGVWEGVMCEWYMMCVHVSMSVCMCVCVCVCGGGGGQIRPTVARETYLLTEKLEFRSDAAQNAIELGGVGRHLLRHPMNKPYLPIRAWRE